MCALLFLARLAAAARLQAGFQAGGRDRPVLGQGSPGRLTPSPMPAEAAAERAQLASFLEQERDVDELIEALAL